MGLLGSEISPAVGNAHEQPVVGRQGEPDRRDPHGRRVEACRRIDELSGREEREDRNRAEERKETIIKPFRAAGAKEQRAADLLLPDAHLAQLGQVHAVEEHGDQREGGREALTRVKPSGVTAVITYNDLMAIGATRQLLSRGLSVPDDVSVAGFDDILIAEYAPVPLTTMRVPTYQIGREGASLVLGALRGDDPADISGSQGWAGMAELQYTPPLKIETEQTQFRQFVRRFLASRLAVGGLVVFVLMVLAAIFALSIVGGVILFEVIPQAFQAIGFAALVLALIGFAGPRVIRQTIGKDLPEGFQRSEFLLEHGFVDIISPRHELKNTIHNVLTLMT